MKNNNDSTNLDNILNFPKAKIKDKEENENPVQIPYKNIFLYGVLIVFLIALILFATNDSSFNATNAVNTEPISLGSANNYALEAYREGYILAKDGRVSCYNTNQELQWEHSVSKTAPTIKTNDKYCLVYYNEDQIVLVTNGKRTRKLKTNANVIYGQVNKNGYCVLFLEEAGLKNKIVVYDNDGEIIYSRQNSDTHIPSAIICDDNHTLLTFELNPKESTTVVKCADIRKSNKILTEIKYKDSVIGGCFFYRNSDFVVISENSIDSYSTKGHKNWSIDCTNTRISKFDYNDSNIFGVVYSMDDSANSSSEVAFYKTNGKKLSSYKSDKKIYDIDLCDKSALLRAERELVVINTKGKLLSSLNLPFDIRNSIFMANQKCAMIVSNSEEAKFVIPR